MRGFDKGSLLLEESGVEYAFFFELFNDVVVLVASAAPAVRQAVNMNRRRFILTRNGTIDLPVAGKEVIFDN